MERKVIHVLTHSIHGLHQEGKTLNYSFYDSLWHFRLARRIQAASDEYEQECWGVDSKLSKEIRWEKDGISVRVFPCKTLRYIGDWYSHDLLRALKAESRKQGVLLHFHGLFSYNTLLAPLVINKVPMIVQHHDTPASLLEQARDSPRASIKLGAFTLYLLAGQWFLERVSIPRFDRIFILNREEEEYVTRLAGTEKVQRLSMGVDFNDFVHTSKDTARQMLELAPDKRYILFVGNLYLRKGVDYLLKSFPAVLKECPNAVLLVVGTGFRRERFVKLAHELGVDARVEFAPSDANLPRVPDNVLPLYYSAADVVVMPSLREGLPIVALEALACDAPLVATNVGGLPDVVATFKAGILVEPRSPEALARAVTDVLNGRKSFVIDRQSGERAYDWRVIAAKNLAVYDTLFHEYYCKQKVNSFRLGY
jgi:glycosyltransferase involved in cell wall biosynthesis